MIWYCMICTSILHIEMLTIIVVIINWKLLHIWVNQTGYANRILFAFWHRNITEITHNHTQKHTRSNEVICRVIEEAARSKDDGRFTLIPISALHSNIVTHDTSHAAGVSWSPLRASVLCSEWCSFPYLIAYALFKRSFHRSCWVAGLATMPADERLWRIALRSCGRPQLLPSIS